MTWSTEGIFTDPATDTILADTGPAVSGVSSIKAIIVGSVSSTFALEHRNADNTVVVKSQLIINEAFKTLQVEFPGVSLDTNERIRLRLVTGVVGTLQASLFTVL